MKVLVTAQLLVPVITEVEAENEQEAVAIARKRILGADPYSEWVLNEEMFSLEGMVLN